MTKTFSVWTYLAAFATGCVLAAGAIALYTFLRDPGAAAERASARAPAAQHFSGRSSPGQAAGGPATAPGDTASAEATRLPTMTVYKSPTCGCCSAWAERMEAAGFRVETRDRADVASKKDTLGVPGPLRSCHTATVGEYVVEGHVPAADVKRLLAEAPGVRGVAVPGMPVGSPGMEVPGRAAESYQVVAFAEGQTAGVFAQH